MKMSKEDINTYRYWDVFYEKITALSKKDNLVPEYKTGEFDMEYHKEFIRLYNIARNTTIKKYISATHTWIVGKSHYSKKKDNWWQAPLECEVCGIGASAHEEVGWAGEREKINFEAGELPSRGMHGESIHRTCEEVQAARDEYRKHRKGSKCGQCRSYGCILKGC